ncbi:glucose 1-dehydrogenase [Actinospica durhamensis]|uniref:Glucose 1-dehydrogenase n=1 Tax=Actinospica durhamensis TaxID=1508375 RepID=A0A941ET67_9ACTN|nr:glucose 1-dehydrogenase [Actinospica durhamensis]MBR7836028.1 glucose 1-dehydrogenase [Actinospica durhamensis]
MTVHTLTGRTALVTGGTRGIGRACALALAAAGAEVVLTGREARTAKAAAEAIAAETGATVTGMSLDVPENATSAETFECAESLLAEIAAEHGELDVLVANAGILRHTPMGLIDAADVQAMVAVNFVGSLAMLQAATASMRRRGGGSAVLISSVVGVLGGDMLAAYAATKAAIAAMARSAARDLGPEGIRVNAIAPGVIYTDMVSPAPREMLDATVARVPMRRVGRPEDVAGAAVFLASDAASYVTGHVLAVDGGMVL